MPATLIKNGIAPAIKELAERLKESGVLNINVQTFDGMIRFSETEEIFLYRAVQEWLNNIMKYAKARTVEIQLVTHPDEFMIMIEDDGTGFDVNTFYNGKGNGWTNIRSRISYVGGRVEIDSQPGYKGTTFIVNIPVNSKIMN